MAVLSSSLAAFVIAAALAGAGAQASAPAQQGPETFDVNASVSAGGANTGAILVPMTIQIDRYTIDRYRKEMLDALQYQGGYPGFLRALRGAPAAGYVEAGGQKFVIRWAHQEPGATGRVVTIVTETPVYFVGSGRRGAKPTAGYEVAAARLTIDASGHGEGVMAAAARVKPDGAGGVTIDNYAETPVKLAATVRARKQDAP